MKKILLALAIGTASLLSFTSCTKEYVDYYEQVPSITLVYERNGAEWGGTNNNAYIDLPVKELTDYYIKQGSVAIAMSGNNETTYHSLPAVIDGVAYSYEYRIGNIRIKAQDPVLDNFDVEVPSLAVFKITLTEADFVE